MKNEVETKIWHEFLTKEELSHQDGPKEDVYSNCVPKMNVFNFSNNSSVIYHNCLVDICSYSQSYDSEVMKENEYFVNGKL